MARARLVVLARVLPSGPQRAADQLGDAVRMPARSASFDERQQRRELAEHLAAPAVIGEVRHGVRQGGQAEHARPALPGSLVGQVPDHPGSLGEQAGRCGKRDHHARAEGSSG